MTIAPRDKGDPAAGAAAEANTASRLRWALVIVPVLVIAIAAAHLIGLWSAPSQQSNGMERTGETEPTDISKSAVPNATSGAAEDAAAAVNRVAPFDATLVLGMIARANPEEGAGTIKMCLACHPAEKNAPFRVATTLWGIVDHPKAAHPGYNYSAALRAKGGTWSYRDLAEYLHNPKKYLPGTSMQFAGITSNERIAGLLAYLRRSPTTPRPCPTDSWPPS